jgi:serine phosphatase RsbU (regulator of sigma subunit)
MEESARRYARRVLIAHVAALVILVLLVFFAGRGIYLESREQAMQQVQRRHALLANQTARGIESFYDGILSDLDLLQKAETADGEPTTRPLIPRGRAPVIFGRVLWRQLESRVTQLFVFDKQTETAFPVGENPADVKIADIAARMTPWLKTVDKKVISGFQLFGEQGANLVCVPTDPRNNRILVAVVPVKQIEQRFLSKINADPTLGATLVDDSYRAMATSRRELIGVNLLEDSPPQHQALIKARAEAGQPFQLTFEDGATIQGIRMPPAILAIEPIDLPGKRWWVYMALPISEVDGALSQLFRRVIGWAIGVVVLMTGVLVSTSIQMIRGRLRVERIQHEMLTKELEQARKIQLAWLPKATVAHGRIDIAARNDPASHISGDFYNWFDLPDGRVVVTIGDVTGHGMSAAFLMATTQLLVRTTMLQTGDPGKALTEINRQLCQQVFNGQFVTMAILVIDPAKQTLDLSLAGHMPPLIGENGIFRPLPSEPQLVLGVEPDETFPTERYALAPGSLLILYTDGVIDAVAPSGERFRLAGVEQALQSTHPTTASTAIAAVTTAVDHFRAGRDLADDLTLVAVQAATVIADQPTISTSSI